MPRIEAIALYELTGKREALIAPNAYVGVRPAEARENLLLLLSDDGRQGITNWVLDPVTDIAPDIGWLAGLDPHRLFTWRDGVVTGRAPVYADQLAACAPIDIALLDLCAQYQQEPLWRLLGEGCRDTVPAYDSTTYFEDLLDPESTVDDVVNRALCALENGHRALKIQIGRGYRWMPWPECTERDVEVCRAVRAAVGPNITLMVDANQGYTGYVEDAADFLSDVDECDIAYAEEMVAYDELRSLRHIVRSRGSNVLFAGGQMANTVEWCKQTRKHYPLDVLQMNLCRTGYVEYLRIAAFAREHNLRVSPHNVGSQLGVYASLHLGKVLPEYMACQCDDATFGGYNAAGYLLSQGEFVVPNAPGLNVRTEDPRIAPSL